VHGTDCLKIDFLSSFLLYRFGENYFDTTLKFIWETKLRESQKSLLNRLDTIELYAQLVGQVVINHQQIIGLIRNTNLQLKADVEAWLHGDHVRDAVRREDYLADRNKNLKSKHEWIWEVQNGYTDEQIISFFELLLGKWMSTQFWLIGESEISANKLVDGIVTCLRDENTIRNKLIHSDFKFHPDLLPMNEIQAARPINTAGKRKGMVEIRVIKSEEMFDFINYQNALIELRDEAELSSGFYFDENYISQNLDKFSATVVDFVENGPLSAGFSDTGQEQIVSQIEETKLRLSEVDGVRQKLKIKSGNFSYDWRMPNQLIKDWEDSS